MSPVNKPKPEAVPANHEVGAPLSDLSVPGWYAPWSKDIAEGNPLPKVKPWVRCELVGNEMGIVQLFFADAGRERLGVALQDLTRSDLTGLQHRLDEEITRIEPILSRAGARIVARGVVNGSILIKGLNAEGLDALAKSDKIVSIL